MCTFTKEDTHGVDNVLTLAMVAYVHVMQPEQGGSKETARARTRRGGKRAAFGKCTTRAITRRHTSECGLRKANFMSFNEAVKRVCGG